MAESEEALQLKRRARRRLVGAVALVTFVVIILPLLLDKEPGPAGPPLDVQIPKQESGGLNARIGPPTALPMLAPGAVSENQAKASPAKSEPSAAAPGAGSKSAVPPAAVAELPAAKKDAQGPKNEAQAAKGEQAPAKTAPAKAVPAAEGKTAAVAAPAADKMERERAEQERAKAALHDEAWVVMLDAFSDANNVKQLRTRLTAAGVKTYTEPVKTSKGELTRVRAGPFGSKEAAETARAKLEAMGLKPGAVASR